MKKYLGFVFILLILFGCQQEYKKGVIGQQFSLQADVPVEAGSVEYIWKITDLPTDSNLLLTDIQFSDDRSQAIFIPDVSGQYTIQVTVWKYNDKLGAFVYNYDISSTAVEINATQDTNDRWLNETVGEEAITENIEDNTTELIYKKDIEKVNDEPVITDPKPEKVVPIKEVTPTTTQPAIVEANFTIQVAAETNVDIANQKVANLITAGYDAYHIEHLSNKKLYRIRIGKYATRAEALQAADKITADQGLSTWVTNYQK